MSRDVFTFGNRTAVVTGGSKNIGLAIAEKLLQAGVQVAIVSANSQHQQAALAHLHKLGYAPTGWLCDVSDVAQLPSTLESIHAHHGSIDILVNCAGVAKVSSFIDFPLEEFERTMNINVTGTLLCSQHATCPRLVLHHDRLAPAAAQVCGQQSGDHVGGAPRRVADQQPHRLIRVGGPGRKRRSSQRGGEEGTAARVTVEHGAVLVGVVWSAELQRTKPLAR
jgi:NAD(P)-dependent dehydrogenase (short-subunit alcohol dehydrogenase family)